MHSATRTLTEKRGLGYAHTITSLGGGDLVSAYYEAMTSADQDLDEALAAVRAEEAEHNITAAEAAAERCELLQRHVDLCRRLRAEHHLGGSGES
jgi:hypothetical protein